MKYMIIALLLFATGCGTVKGLASDISWTANQIDQSIVIPE